MTHRSYAATHGLFNLALASRGLAPTHVRADDDVEGPAPAASSVGARLAAFATTLVRAIGTATRVPPVGA